MNKRINYIFFLLIYSNFLSNAYCQIEKSIPLNWIISQKLEGDFNMDGMQDYFVLIDSMDIKNSWITQKRHVLIFHGSSKGLYLADKNILIFSNMNRIVDTDVINLTAKGNIIKLGLGDINFGGGRNGSLGYTFRFQNNKWYAIGCGFTCDKVISEDEGGESVQEEDFSYNFVTGNYERIVKTDSEVKHKTLKKRTIHLPLFSEYDGQCHELIK